MTLLFLHALSSHCSSSSSVIETRIVSARKIVPRRVREMITQKGQNGPKNSELYLLEIRYRLENLDEIESLRPNIIKPANPEDSATKFALNETMII